MSEIRSFDFSNQEAPIVFGKYDENLQLLEKILTVEIFGRGNSLKIKGTRANLVKTLSVLEKMQRMANSGKSVGRTEILDILSQSEEEQNQSHAPKFTARIETNSKKTAIYPHSSRQASYIAALRKYDLTVGIGPAGTGKTYLAVACAIEALKQGRYNRIILTRPALEAGERLGFLPGDLEEKIRPYLQPIYDALFEIMKYEELKRWSERKLIEVVPLAYMRGRTLSRAFIILDEAQNTTFKQIQMFLTRLGQESRAVITGDITQIDSPLTSETSGLVEIQSILKGIPGVKFLYFSQRDVVRHPLVKRIIAAYERHNQKKQPGVLSSKSSEKSKN